MFHGTAHSAPIVTAQERRKTPFGTAHCAVHMVTGAPFETAHCMSLNGAQTAHCTGLDRRTATVRMHEDYSGYSVQYVSKESKDDQSVIIVSVSLCSVTRSH